MPSIITIELDKGRLGPVQLQTPPEKTAAKMLGACSRKSKRGKGSLSPKGKPNFLLEGEDVVAGGMTYVFTPIAGSQGMRHILHVMPQTDSQDLVASALCFHSSSLSLVLHSRVSALSVAVRDA